MKRLAVIILMICCGAALRAQSVQFVSSGQITFERKVNTYAAMSIFLKETERMSDNDVAIYMQQQYRSNNLQFWTDSFYLYFDSTRTLYKPANDEMGFSKSFQIPVAYKNRVYSDLRAGIADTEKQAFEKSSFIRDSLKSVRWKLTDETREIAGYQCYRANALLFDSIYIVAFYTDQILCKGGPESFNGLPGMILGIAIPHKHITLFATSVNTDAVPGEKWPVPQPGKRDIINNKTFNSESARLLKQFGLTSSWVQFFMDL